MAVDHDAARHLKRGACCGAPFSQSHRQALESSSDNHGMPPRGKGYRFDFVRGSGLDLTAYTDAGYADKSNDRRSVSGAAITLGVLPSVGQVARRGLLRRLQQKQSMQPWVKG